VAVAHLNWGILRADWDAPEVAPFVEALDRVNALAERSPGFLWRLDDEAMEAGQLAPNGALGGHPRLASTLSLWDSVAALRNFTYDSLHGAFYNRRTEWFEPRGGQPAYVLWPHHDAARPTLAEGVRRLDLLDRLGPSEAAFDFEWAGRQEGQQ
jgi:hypothetical protein